ncbi:tetratricopeptide repeat protein [Kaistia dalseonensis]|uniref:Tetratricopeptide (TPR) repeat protein n=1 Tax=Kaistia dalseonensis TaxID=410840 RepID=A0ABU0HCU1_9HYPH|nr:tetratricopeptide repeat protein [Kaistia dalseonensis]MCX5497494.1 tetratricopeptide repeat protein [Kaistia dalseonensis]MDQ0440133.1 tetratricopeptide (TPR) repeat protein [Kaistia dalseonensis]
MLKSRARSLRYAAVCLALVSATGLVMTSLPARAETTISDLLPDDVNTTLSGSYLAALSATRANDIDAATIFFEDALSQDPDNALLIDRTFTLLLVSGRIDEAFPLAERLIQAAPTNRMGQIVLALKALKAKDYKETAQRLDKGDRGPLANLSAGLLSAWAAQGQGETDGAIKIVETLQGPDWYGVFKDFNVALILDVAGRHDEAMKAIERAYKTDASSMRIVEAFARMAARNGRVDDAKRALLDFSKTSAGQPIIRGLLSEIESGKTPAPLVSTVQQGAAEVLYGLGSALGTEKGGADLGIVYLRLALYLEPRSDLMIMALGDMTQNDQQFERSIPIFESVPKSSPLRRNADLQIALSLDALGRSPEAIKRLSKLVAANPRDFEALTTLGTIYRSNKRFTEATDVYTKAIGAIGKQDPRNWLLLYYRGVAEEQNKQWPKAEADFLAGLALAPNEPQLLNYLGYSYVDRGINLDRAMDMIKQAVDLKPNDGYIVDSLGWAYYRTGKYDEAVGQLERAISLKPDDSTINDHLGDAYWKVGRKLEATFQWAHARDLDPEPDAKARILEKLAKGLDKVEETQVAAAATTTATDATAPAAKTEAKPATYTIGKGDSFWSIAVKVYGDGHQFQRLIDANRDKIKNPNSLPAGLVIDVPPLVKAP